jgi:5'-nucleotidase/UDP-sugar diphosphatase
VVGQLDVDFDAQGNVKSCAGTPHLLIGNALEREGRPLEPADRAAALADIATGGVLRITPSSPAAQARLAAYRQRKQVLGQEVIARATENLCLRRIPGQRLDVGRSALGDTCNLDPHVQAHGGDIQQHVAQGLLLQGRQYFGAQIALQNAGGVRTDVPRGDIDVEMVYGLLPFGNALVRLEATGRELKQALEDAVDAIVSRQASGSYPYAAGLRWKVDLGQPGGSRLSELEVHDERRGWQPLRPDTTYTVATTDFLADGMDGYTALGMIRGERRENVGLVDAEIFLEYLKTLPGSPAQLARLPTPLYSTQAFIGP